MIYSKNLTGLTFITNRLEKNGLTLGALPRKGLLLQLMSQTMNDREALSLLRRLVTAVERIADNTMPESIQLNTEWDHDDADRIPDFMKGNDE